MARTTPSALMEHILPKMMEFYRGRPAIYQQVDDRENNNYSYNNNNITEDDREVGIFNSGRPGMKKWISANILRGGVSRGGCRPRGLGVHGGAHRAPRQLVHAA
eukprot:GFUD01012039.1.p2 GENE.GFUD01012039.1~~GFUD01012039.1.p2  ORF type:complete len:104 (+),score=18.38 GFUD01012039.1:507-818(+)